MRAVALDSAEESMPVAMTTSAGRLRGRWMGSAPIRVGESVDVELDLGPSRAWDELVEHAVSHDDAGHLSRVPGLVEQVFDDGVIFLRVGEGLVLLDVTGAIPDDAEGTSITIPADDLSFYPTGI